MKTCKKCGEAKPLDEFYKHPKMADGHLNECKTCKRAYARDINKDGRRQEYDRERGRTAARRAKHARYMATEAGQAAARAGKQRWAEKNKKKRAAHNWVSNALRDGRLTPCPCEVCGNERAEAHHPDYDRPDFVQWLCTFHHAELHRLEREAQRLQREITRKS